MHECERGKGREGTDGKLQLNVFFIAGTNGAIRGYTVITSNSPPKKEI